MKKNTIQAGTHEVDQSFILRSGSVLRKFKIDELLQLINVLKGEISLVGPRPCLETQIELIKCREDLKIFDIKPGITGLSQVCGVDMSKPDMLAKVDSYYIRNQSLSLDCMIIIATVSGFFQGSLKKKIKLI